jgi:hypothetical protein
VCGGAGRSVYGAAGSAAAVYRGAARRPAVEVSSAGRVQGCAGRLAACERAVSSAS